MWMPLGWVSASGSGGATASYELISTTVLGSSTPSVTFSITGAQQSAYKHLQLRIAARGDNASTQSVFNLRFNSDTGLNYSVHRLTGNGTNVTSGGNANNDYGYAGILPAGNASANIFGASVIDILDAFSTNKNKTVRTLTGNTAGNEIDLYTSGWYNTSAISSITVYPGSGNAVTGSRFSLYGVRG